MTALKWQPVASSLPTLERLRYHEDKSDPVLTISTAWATPHQTIGLSYCVQHDGCDDVKWYDYHTDEDITNLVTHWLPINTPDGLTLPETT